MKKKVSKQQRNLKRAKKENYRQIREAVQSNTLPTIDYGAYETLRHTDAYAGNPEDYGKLLYSYSDARTWVDLPRGQKFRKIFVPQRVILFTLAALLCAWFITALTYRLCTTTNVGKTLLDLLPSFIIIAFLTAILLISVFLGWGKFMRWAFRHNLVHAHRNPILREQYRQFKADLENADMRKPIENRFDITRDYVILTVWGNEFVFHRNRISVTAKKEDHLLTLTFEIAGRIRQFPATLPEEEYAAIKKVLRGQLTAVRTQSTDTAELREKFIKEIPYLFGVFLIFAAGVMLVVTHYVWVPDIPPFLGVFFIGMSFLALCNSLSFIPNLHELCVPLIFSLILLVVPPWALVWFQQNVFHSGGNILKIILRCDAFTAAFSTFTVLGVFVFTFAINKIVDHIRFGETE